MTHFSPFGVTIMEQITLGQIASGIALLGGLITGATLILTNLKKWLTAALNEKFNAIDLRLDEMTESMDAISMDNCKNFLVQCIADFEHGTQDPVELSRFWEVYDYYTNHGGNSYIRERVDQLKERGLL